VKSLKLRLLLLCMAALANNIQAANCAFVTGVTCPTNCDDNGKYKTCDGDYYGKTFFSFRPQDSDSSRRILGWFNQDYTEQVYPEVRQILTISPQYTRSFNPKQIAQWFFFNGCPSMTVGVPNEYQDFDIDGTQIGLSLGTLFDPDTYTLEFVAGKIGTVSARPIVENYIVDFDLWYDLSKWHEKLWSRIEFPLVYMKTNMQMCSSGVGSQEDEYPFGLFSLTSTALSPSDYVCDATPVPYNSITAALEGNKGWGVVQPLECGKFSTREKHQWGIAGLHFDLGYDIYKELPWYCAASFHVVCPTGTRPKGTYVFEPVIGANKSWQIGATFISNYIKKFYRCELGVYLYAVGTHLFKASQDRVYALGSNGAGSQLLLLKQFQLSQTGLVDAPREANIFCGRSKIGSTFMFDGSLMFQLTRNKFVADLGFNYWARTKEKRYKTVNFRGFYEGAIAVKGDTPMSSQVQVPPVIGPVQCVSDFTTDSTATIAGPTEPDVPNGSQVTEISSGSVFLVPGNVDYGSPLQPTSMSYKVFGGVGYKSSWFILLSGEGEFGTNNAVINQWGVMLKVGKDF
jgi:hypothetical protein